VGGAGGRRALAGTALAPERAARRRRQRQRRRADSVRGLWLALEGAVPSQGRRWHRSRLHDGGGNGNGVARTQCRGAGAVVGAGGRHARALGLWLALEGAVPSRGWRWHRSGLHDGGGNGNGVALTLGGALGLWLARKGAVPSRGRRRHRSDAHTRTRARSPLAHAHTHAFAAVSAAGAARSVAPTPIHP
jgi:hypothetical protein